MGITGLWDVLNDAGEIVHIADYAARRFERHNRPLRIAVDEACWRFTNLTPEQVERIREGEPAANPVEKTILWRVLRLMKLNIQLLFVYDGPRRPWKRNKRGGGLVDRELTKLLHQLLDHLKIPYHQAPGEAEAECAALQKCGVVDAVWADDGDAFMFGATTLIKQHKVNNERVKDHVKVFTADAIRRKLDFDADSFMLFALLSGGDYDTTGLRGCGPQVARRAARCEHRVATAARHVRQNQLPQWRAALQLVLRLCGRPLEVPADFPDFKALGHYRDPAISPPEQLDDLRRLRQGWDPPIDQRKLRILLRDRFNMWTRGYLKHIAPLYLARALARVAPEQRAENTQYGVLLKRTQKRKTTDGEDAPAKAERKITFHAAPAVEIDLSEQPPEEDWSMWHGKDGSPYDPLQPVECEVLDCFLHHGLVEDAIVTATGPTRKKRKNEDDAEDSPKAKKVKAAFTVALSGAEEVVADCTAAESPAIPRKREKARKKDPTDAAPKKPPKKAAKAGDAPVEEPVSAPPAVFRLPNISPAPHVQSQAGRSDPRSSSMTDDERLARQLQQEEIAQAGGGPDSFGFHDLYDDDRDADSQPSGLPQGSVDNETSASSLFVAPLKTKPPLANVAGPAGEASRSALIDRAPAAVYRPVGETDDMARSFEPTVTARLSTVAKAPTNCSTEEGLVPGEVIASASLRELRATAFLARYPKMPPTIPTSAGAFGNAAPKITKLHEVIDLT